MTRRPDQRVWHVCALALILSCGAWPGRAQETPATAESTTQPVTQAASQPTTTQAARDEQQEAAAREELAAQQIEQARTELEAIREVKERVAQPGPQSLLPGLADFQQEALTLEEEIAEREVHVGELRKEYAEKQRGVADRKIAIQAEKDALAARLATIAEMTASERVALALDYDRLATHAREASALLEARVEEARVPLTASQDLRRAHEERLAAAEEAERPVDQLRAALDQMLGLIDNQRLIAYVLAEQANEELRLAETYERGAEELREYNRRFWVRHAWLLNVGRILIYALVAHFGLSILAWLVGSAIATTARRLRRDHATPMVKRVQTLIQFARSITKLLVWIVATVTILNEFGIEPGKSAGALGVIGLVLAGMFQQLVVDFVKGIDIAVGGHYFVGDFVQVGAHAGHVLDFTVKYTVLRTPSGQVITVPNSQCIPSRRFPSGYVDNYVDFTLGPGTNTRAAELQLAEVGRLLNARIEAVKREPHISCTFEEGERTIIRTRVRVLPTCDWVIKEHYIPMVKERFAAANIALITEPEFFFLNDIPTFRRLFSRQMTDRDIADTLAAESRPTMEREAMPDAAETAQEEETQQRE